MGEKHTKLPTREEYLAAKREVDARLITFADECTDIDEAARAGFKAAVAEAAKDREALLKP